MASFASSYIPTTTATVTRAADVASITGTNFSSWYNQTEGTVFAEFGPYGNTGTSANPGIVQANNGTGANRVALFAGLTTVPVFAIDNTSVNQAYLNTPGVLSPTVTSKLSGAYRSNDFARTVNGGNLATDASGTVPTVNQLQIGAGLGGIAGLNGTIKRLTYWPVRLANTTLQSITTP